MDSPNNYVFSQPWKIFSKIMIIIITISTYVSLHSLLPSSY